MEKKDDKLSFSSERDSWLEAPDEKFTSLCKLDFFKASGNGGQKRNKCSTAVRITHLPSGISATSCNTRSQHQNRSDAIRKLKEQIALNVRSESFKAVENIGMSLSNPDYPQWIASVFDVLFLHSFSLKDAAAEFNISSSKLQKLIARDPMLWQELNRLRQANGLPPLRQC